MELDISVDVKAYTCPVSKFSLQSCFFPGRWEHQFNNCPTMSNLDHLKPSATCFLRCIFQCQKPPLAHSPCRFVAMPSVRLGSGPTTLANSALFIDFGLAVPSLFQPLLDKIAGTIPGTPQDCYSVSNSEVYCSIWFDVHSFAWKIAAETCVLLHAWYIIPCKPRLSFSKSTWMLGISMLEWCIISFRAASGNPHWRW
jgi:hypothetical protein